MSDKILISGVGLYETIRCTICENPNKTERGCDGACQYDKELHAKIVEAVTGLAEQRPHGEWIPKQDDDGGRRYVCSNCGEPCYTLLWTEPEPRDRFCLWCGSDNRPKEGEAE